MTKSIPLLSAEESMMSNEFAAALMMPRDEFILKCKELSDDGKINIKLVAEHFNVTVRSAIVRGVVLGLWADV